MSLDVFGPVQGVQGAGVGEVKVKVLLVDFPDRPGTLERSHYEGLLFSEGKYPIGSMRDFYKEAFAGKAKEKKKTRSRK